MKKLFVLVLCLTLLTCFSGASPILTEKQAKQLLRSRRQDRPSKPGFPDEPMRARAPRTYYAHDISNGNSVANGQSTRIPRGLPDATPEPDVRALCPEYMHHLLRLEHRAEEQFLEHWLNPHCKPHCDRNVVHPV